MNHNEMNLKGLLAITYNTNNYENMIKPEQ